MRVCIYVWVCMYMYKWHLLYSFIYWWALRLLPYFGCCKYIYMSNNLIASHSITQNQLNSPKINENIWIIGVFFLKVLFCWASASTINLHFLWSLLILMSVLCVLHIAVAECFFNLIFIWKWAGFSFIIVTILWFFKDRSPASMPTFISALASTSDHWTALAHVLDLV